MLKAVIIDDEILAINLIETLLGQINGVQLVGKFTCHKEGLASIRMHKPDVIFLDIEMPGRNGIKMAEKISEIDSSIDIVFVTAYTEYSLEAFRVYAVDYLLKPTNKARLNQTVEKIIQRRGIVVLEENKKLALKVQFWGNFVLYDKHGNPIKWRTKKEKELCAYLLHYKEPVHRIQIIEELWPTISVEKAATMLHTTIYQLRKKLKDNGFSDPLPYTDERYFFNVACTYDVAKVLEKIKNADFSDEFILNLVHVATKGYLGFEDYPWSQSYKEKLFTEIKLFLEQYIIQHSNLTQKSGVWRLVLEKLIELDPFVEVYYQELIKHYLQMGNVKMSQEIYQKLKRLLWEELKEAPSQEIEKLFAY